MSCCHRGSCIILHLVRGVAGWAGLCGMSVSRGQLLGRGSAILRMVGGVA